MKPNLNSMLATILRQKMKKIRWLAEIPKQNVIVLHFVESKANVKLLRYSYPRINRNKTLPTYILHTPNNKQSLNYFVFLRERKKNKSNNFLHYFWSGILNGQKIICHIYDYTPLIKRHSNEKKIKENEGKCIALNNPTTYLCKYGRFHRIKNNNNTHKHSSPRYY